MQRMRPPRQDIPQGTAALTREESDVLVAEMRSLVLSHEARDAARDRCITSCIGLIGFEVKRSGVARRLIPDLISHLQEQLIIAVDNFDTSRDVKLATYVSKCLAYQVHGFKMAGDPLIHIPKYVRLQKRNGARLDKFQKNVESAAATVAALLAGQWEQDAYRSFSGHELIDHVVESPLADDDSDRDRAVKRVLAAIDALLPSDAELVKSYFGIGRPRETYEALGHKEGVVRETIRLRLRRVLEILRSRLCG